MDASHEPSNACRSAPEQAVPGLIDRRQFMVAAGAFAATSMSVRVATAQAPERMDFERIATEEAWAIPELLDAMREVVGGNSDDPEYSSIRMLLGADNPVGRYVRPRLTDIETRLRDMDEHGVAMHVLSVTTPGVQVFEPKRGNDLARLLNDRLAAIIRQHPKRFAGLAAIAPQDPQSAAREIERAITQLKLNGVIVNSHTNGEYLDEQKYWPILEAAAAHNAPIYIHPRTPAPGLIVPYQRYALDNAIWGFQADTSLHGVRLIASGVFDRFPALKIVLGHGGEGIPFWLHRLDYMHTRSAKWAPRPKLERAPSEYFSDNFVITTSGQNWNPVLQFCLNALGSENIMWAIDYPYQGTSEAVAFMNNAPISAEDKRKIFSANARRVFRITT